MERNLKISIFSFIYIYLHSTEFLLICHQFNDVTIMVFRPETRRSRHTADRPISRKLGFMSEQRSEGSSSNCIRRLQVKFSTTGTVMYIRLYSLANGPLQIVVNFTPIPFFIQIFDLCLFVLSLRKSMICLHCMFVFCNFYRVNYQ